VNRRPARLASCLAAIAFAPLALCGSANGATADEENLAKAYAPILMLRAQEDPVGDPCKATEEQYNPPTTVQAVLGNPRVKLVHRAGGRDVVLKQAPTAADIAGLDGSFYLDLPGDPLRAKCTYARDYAGLKAEGSAPAITYAHIATEPGHSELVVQYWFFYYFNQFNDVHEGDWEGMQIAFDAATPREALEEGPSEIALFQHGSSEHPGGERADWDDTKVQKDGDHPIVYPAAGSHATFYADAIYVENGRNGSGLGCDDSSQPHTQADPRPVVVPTDAPPGSEFQWLGYLGHWGQREKGFNNGPTGPVTKQQWREPFTWMSGVRQDSPRLPGGSLLGPAPATVFCGAIAQASKFVNLEAKDTFGAILLGLGLLLLLAVPPLLTRWRPVDVSTLRHRWAIGQLLRGAGKVYVRNWRVLVPIGLSALIVIGAFEAAQYVFEQVRHEHDLTFHLAWGGFDLRFSGSIDGLEYPIGGTIVSGAAVAFLRLRENGEPASFIDSYHAIYERVWRIVFGQLLALALVYVMVFTVIGIPFGIYFYIAWQFIQQEILFDDRSIREAMRGSHWLVRGHWWRTVVVAGLLLLVSVVTGPVLGFVLIFLNWSPILVNAVGSIVFALLMPFVAVGRTLLYFDLGAREEEGVSRRWRWWPRTAEST
jgi:hypothetical protein